MQPRYGTDGRFRCRVPAVVQKWIWISVAALCAAIAATLLLVKPVVRDRMEREAERRGLKVDVRDIDVGLGSITLKGARVKVPEIRAVDVRLDEVQLDLAWLSLAEVRVEGGTVTIHGTLEEVLDQVKAYRARRSQKSAAGKPGVRERRDIVRNLEVKWKGALGGEETQLVQGLHVERTPEVDRIGADLVDLSYGIFQLQVAGGEAEWKQEDSGRTLHRVGAAEMRVSARDPGTSQEPSAAPGATPPPEPKTKEARGLDELLSVEPERVAKLQTLLSLLREKVIPRLPRTADVKQLWLSYASGDERLQVGPSLVRAETTTQGLSVSLTPRADARGTPLSLSLMIPIEREPMTASLSGGPVSFETLGVANGDFGLTGVQQTTLMGKAELRVSADASALSGEGKMSVENLAVKSDRLAPHAVSFPRLFLGGKADVAVDGSRLNLDEVALEIGQVRVFAGVQLEKRNDEVTLAAKLKAPLVSCEALVDSAPRGLLGPVADMQMAGTFSLDAGVEAKSDELSKMKVQWDFNNECRVQAVPASLDPERFREPFDREVLGAGGLPMRVEFGPGTPEWTPISEISPHMEKALLVTEDGRFFGHDGFDDRAIEASIRENTKAGAFVRGASTISMQLAKNLYLSRHKTLARKLQEAAFTLLLEQAFEKRELLELYLNVVEFGPGIYGIGRAAEHYFDSAPRELSPAQALFLASVLPSPTQSYFGADGRLIEGRAEYVRHLLRIAHERDHLTKAELEEALKEELRFGEASQPADDFSDDIFGGNLADQPLRPHRSDVLRKRDPLDAAPEDEERSRAPMPPLDTEPRRGLGAP